MSKYNINRVDFVLLEQLVLVQQPYKAGMPWQFAGSFYYATTVLTTIGKQVLGWAKEWSLDCVN